MINLLLAMHRDFRTTLVLVTHDQDLADRMERIVTLRDGRIESDQLTAPLL